jgi:hypothetical protein
METKEAWIEETMNALDGIARAESNPSFREKTMQGLRQNQTEMMKIQPGLIWKLAACIAILVTINIFTLISINPSAGTDHNTVKSVANEYFSYIDSYNL